MKTILYVKITDEDGKIYHDVPCEQYANIGISLIDGDKWNIEFYYRPCIDLVETFKKNKT